MEGDTVRSLTDEGAAQKTPGHLSRRRRIRRPAADTTGMNTRYTPNHLTGSQRTIAGDYANYLELTRTNSFYSNKREGWIAVNSDQEKTARAAGAKTMSQVLDHVVYGDYLPVGERARIRKALGFE